MLEVSDDGINSFVLKHHFLMVRVALDSSSGLDGFAHKNIAFKSFFLLVGELREYFLIFIQKFDISKLLSSLPLISPLLFCLLN
jgi:hypothetical protein